MNKKYQEIVRRLGAGEVVVYREGGSSMEPRLHGGDPITARPIPDHDKIKAGDIVLCKVNGRMMTHLVWSKQWRTKNGVRKLWFQIGNNHGFENGWTPAERVYGRVDG